MGTTSTTSNSTQQVTPTPQEQGLEQNELNFSNFAQPLEEQTYGNLSSNINAILTGQTPMAQGIGGISDSQTQSMVNQSLRDIMPQFQSSGILNSGEAAQVANLTAAQTRNSNAQFNVSAAQNLFNLAAGGQSNLQSQANQNNSTLGSQLAGLRTTTSSGSVSQNPFLNSFYQGLGTQASNTVGSIGNSAISAGTGGASSFGSAFAAGCWVAAEVFDGWSDVRTNIARFYIMFHAPKWFRNMYMKFGPNIANFIHNKPILKNMIKP